jgi:hypothetical protein
MLRADAVMAAVQPAFQVRKDKLDDGEVFFRHFRVASFDNRQMFETLLGKAGVTGSGIRYDPS